MLPPFFWLSVSMFFCFIFNNISKTIQRQIVWWPKRSTWTYKYMMCILHYATPHMITTVSWPFIVFLCIEKSFLPFFHIHKHFGHLSQQNKIIKISRRLKTDWKAFKYCRGLFMQKLFKATEVATEGSPPFLAFMFTQALVTYSTGFGSPFFFFCYLISIEKCHKCAFTLLTFVLKSNDV